MSVWEAAQADFTIGNFSIPTNLSPGHRKCPKSPPDITPNTSRSTQDFRRAPHDPCPQSRFGIKWGVYLTPALGIAAESHPYHFPKGLP